MDDGLVLSTLDWWAEAGVDTIVGETPHDWLAIAIAASPVPAPGPAADQAPPLAAPAAESAFPGDLAAFRTWLLRDAAVPGPAGARLDAEGDPVHKTMVILDMPEAGDRDAGRLLAGDAGHLFDRMLTAMKLDRAAIYLAPFSPARPATGRLGEAHCATLANMMRHHVRLVAPDRLLLLGDAPVRALLDLPLAQARGETRRLASTGVAVPAIASFSPRFVLERPEFRKAAWTDLQLFMAL